MSPAPVFLQVNDVGARRFLSSSNCSADFLLFFLVVPPRFPCSRSRSAHPPPPWINGTVTAVSPQTGCAGFSLSFWFGVGLTPYLPRGNPRRCVVGIIFVEFCCWPETFRWLESWSCLTRPPLFPHQLQQKSIIHRCRWSSSLLEQHAGRFQTKKWRMVWNTERKTTIVYVTCYWVGPALQFLISQHFATGLHTRLIGLVLPGETCPRQETPKIKLMWWYQIVGRRQRPVLSKFGIIRG